MEDVVDNTGNAQQHISFNMNSIGVVQKKVYVLKEKANVSTAIPVYKGMEPIEPNSKTDLTKKPRTMSSYSADDWMQIKETDIDTAEIINSIKNDENYITNSTYLIEKIKKTIKDEEYSYYFHGEKEMKNYFLEKLYGNRHSLKVINVGQGTMVVSGEKINGYKKYLISDLGPNIDNVAMFFAHSKYFAEYFNQYYDYWENRMSEQGKKNLEAELSKLKGKGIDTTRDKDIKSVEDILKSFIGGSKPLLTISHLHKDHTAATDTGIYSKDVPCTTNLDNDKINLIGKMNYNVLPIEKDKDKDENENSLVIYKDINEDRFLITGDQRGTII